jgi:hypothetical protein
MDANKAIRDVETIRRVAKGLSRQRDDVYLLMTVTYRIGRKWINSGQAKEMRNLIIQQLNLRIDPRVKKSVLRFLVEIGYPGGVKLRSRYANALRYAYAHKCRPDDLPGFLKSRGGIEGCAKRYIMMRRQTRRVPTEPHSKRIMSW